jgi:uncharacterized Zn-binding protein involved in type VI secretion
MVTGVVPHVGGPIILGSPDVITGDLPQARVTDMLTCVGPPDMIVQGSTGVFVNELPAARLGDMTAHGGVIVVGLPTVLIGETGGGGGGAGAGAGGGGGGGDEFTTAISELATYPIDPGGAAVAAAAPKAQALALRSSAETGKPFCEICYQQALERLRRKQGG